MHKNFAEIIRTLRRHLPENTIECNTNGDKLSISRILELYEAGLSMMYVNLYDGPKQIEIFKALFAAAGIKAYKLRPHWGESHGLTLNNRAGALAGYDAVEGRCHYPFYKMLVDWNGDVLFCSNDWQRKIIVGNVMKEHIADIWLSEQMKTIRLGLATGDRNRDPCKSCSVNGTLHGKPSFDRLMEYYG